jgi:hypothetical protein
MSSIHVHSVAACEFVAICIWDLGFSACMVLRWGIAKIVAGWVPEEKIGEFVFE